MVIDCAEQELDIINKTGLVEGIRMENKMLILRNDFVEIGFSDKTGSIIHFKDAKRNIDFVNSEGAVPFRILLKESLETKILYTQNKNMYVTTCTYITSITYDTNLHCCTTWY